MSYCRFSSDNWKSDVYCYSDCRGGITTHVAGNRIVGDVPKVPSITKTNFKEWAGAHKRQEKFLETVKRKPIGLKYDGEDFNDPDEAAFLDRLLELKSVGYHVPEYVIEDLKWEAK